MIYTLGLLPVLLLGMGLPIFLVLLTASTVTLILLMKIPLAVLHQTMFNGINSFPLLAIPFFLFAGELMGRGTVARRLVDVVQAGTGRARGSIGLTTVGTSTIFGAISGASAATVATVGKIMLPAMDKAGYPRSFSAGLITGVGAIDIIIPPSIPMIVYGAATQESIPRLYAAGILPGVLMAALIAVYVWWYAQRHGVDAGDPFSLRRLAGALARGSWALGAPVIILGGIYGGLFSPTEAGGIACVYAALVACVVYRDIPWKAVMEAAHTTVLFTAQILVILACASVYSWLVTVNQVPAALVGWIGAMGAPQWLVLAAANVLLLAVGCVLDPLSAILLLAPLLLPVVQAVGVDPLHFGIVVIFNLAIGLFTPPFGINIFVAQSALGLPLATIYRGILPFVALYLVGLALITYVPEISLVGARLLLGK